MPARRCCGPPVAPGANEPVRPRVAVDTVTDRDRTRLGPHRTAVVARDDECPHTGAFHEVVPSIPAPGLIGSTFSYLSFRRRVRDALARDLRRSSGHRAKGIGWCWCRARRRALHISSRPSLMTERPPRLQPARMAAHCDMCRLSRHSVVGHGPRSAAFSHCPSNGLPRMDSHD
jgi:hypothetical protein